MTDEMNLGLTAKKSSRNNNCYGAHKDSLRNMGAETRGDDDIEKNLHKMIPDGWVGRFIFVDASSNLPPNRLDDCEAVERLARGPTTNTRYLPSLP